MTLSFIPGKTVEVPEITYQPEEDVEQAAMAKAAPAVPATPADRAAEMRRTIAAAMARSKREIPHYYLSTEVPLARAAAWLAAENEKREITGRLLMAALFLKATALALKRYPDLNGFVFATGASSRGRASTSVSPSRCARAGSSPRPCTTWTRSPSIRS